MVRAAVLDTTFGHGGPGHHRVGEGTLSLPPRPTQARVAVAACGSVPWTVLGHVADGDPGGRGPRAAA